MGLFGKFQTKRIMSPSKAKTTRTRAARSTKAKGAQSKAAKSRAKTAPTVSKPVSSKAKGPAGSGKKVARPAVRPAARKESKPPTVKPAAAPAPAGVAPAPSDTSTGPKPIPVMRERVLAAPARHRAATPPSPDGRYDLANLPAEGANGRFCIHFVYNGMQFSVRVLAKDARGSRLQLEGHLGFVPFAYEGPDMRGQMLEVLQLARRQKAVHINLVGEQRIALTAELAIEGPLTANSIVSAAASRIAAVKPLLDVIRALQPYRRDDEAPAAALSAA